MTALRSALIIPFAGISSVVDAWRARTCGAKPSVGVPPHVTLAFPFVAPGFLDHVLVDELRTVAAAAAPFEVVLRSFGRFPRVLWLAPEPVAPFAALHERIHAAFPGHPLHGDPSLAFV